MATIPVQQAPVTGLDTVVFAAAVGPDSATSGVCTVLLVKNDDAAAKTVTVVSPGTVSGLQIEDPAVVVPAGEIGAVPLVGRVFGATASWDYSPDVTNVSVAVVQLDR